MFFIQFCSFYLSDSSLSFYKESLSEISCDNSLKIKIACSDLMKFFDFNQN